MRLVQRLPAVIGIAIAFLIALIGSSNEVIGQEKPAQRMRLPVGSYFLSAGGAGGGGIPPNAIVLQQSGDEFILPAFCVDGGRRPPPRSASRPIKAFAGNARITKLKDGELVEERSLVKAAAGPNPWVILGGLGSAERISIKPTDDNFEYLLTVDGLTLAGEDQDHVNSGFAAWQSRPDLVQVNDAFDTFRSALIKGGVSSGALYQLELQRQRFEWEAFGESVELVSVLTAIKNQDILMNAVDSVILAYLADNGIFDGGGIYPVPLRTGAARLEWLTWFAAAADLSAAEAEGLRRAMNVLGAELPTDGEQLSVESKLLLASLADVYNSDRRLRAAFPKDDNKSVSGDQALKKVSRARVGSAVRRLFEAGRNGAKTFREAMRVAAFSRFDPRDIASGRLELDVLEELNCATELNPKSVEAQAEVVLAQQPRLLIDLALRLGVERDRAASLYVKLSVSDDLVCLEWIEPNGDVIRRVVQRDEIVSTIRADFSSHLILADVADADLKKRLANARLASLSVRQARLRAATDSLDVLGRIRSDYVVRGPTLSEPSGVKPKLAVFELEGRGDANAIRLSDGSTLLIDTGGSADLVQKVKEFIEQKNGGTGSIRLVITHTHQDHIGGLRALVESKIPIDEILIGLSNEDELEPLDSTAPLDQLNSLRQLLRAQFVEKSANGMLHFARKEFTGAWIDPRIPTRSVNGIDTFEVVIADETVVSMHHDRDAVHPNDGGVVVRVRSKGESWLLTDDLSATTMRRLLETIPGELSAGVMKWPHHLWLPRENTNDRTLVENFLQVVGAYVYFFSNYGHKKTHTPKRLREIKKVIEKILVGGMIMEWTDKGKVNLVYQASH